MPTMTRTTGPESAVQVTEVLIVEDEPDIAELMRFHAEREGYKAHVVQSGRIALDTVKRQRPDIILLDLMLPDLNGLEVCRRLKWDKSTRDIPVLIVSAKGDESDIVTGLELGADDYVTKPFSPKVLMARMKNIIRRQESEEKPGTRAPESSRAGRWQGSSSTSTSTRSPRTTTSSR